MSYLRVRPALLGPGAGLPHPVGGYDQIEVGQASVHYRCADAHHRLDGPALIRYGSNGRRTRTVWYRHGVIHREDGPAVESDYPSGAKAEWLHDGVLHRIDGPARTYRAGDNESSEWWVRGTPLTAAEFIDFRAALESGSPIEWAMAYATGSPSA